LDAALGSIYTTQGFGEIMQKLHEVYVENIKQFPIFTQLLADQLGISTESLAALEVGLCPHTDWSHWCWTWPERNAKGQVIGLSTREVDHKKAMIPKSKHGLFYQVSNQTLYHGTHWVRVSKDFPCLVCGKADGCMYPAGEYDNPNAVVCVHIPSDTPLSDKAPGYIHVFDPSRTPHSSSQLPASSLPVLVVEGASDVCAAYDLGFVAVGRPSAQGGLNDLPGLVGGREVIVIGENDAGAGKSGMETAFNALRDICPKCTKAMPPNGIKDLRGWVQSGLTKAEFLDYIQVCGDSTKSEHIFDSDMAPHIAEKWFGKHKKSNGVPLLRTYRGGYIEFNGHCYEERETDTVDGEVYRYLEGKQYQTEKGEIKLYKPTQCKVKDILHACTAFCPIESDSPAWINGVDGPDPKQLIVFKNGVLNVDDYIHGNCELHDPTPNLFSFTVLPYSFVPELESKLWEDFLNDIFNEDQDKIRLLRQWFGYNLVPDMRYEKLMLLVGRPRSGKGCTLEALQAMLGDRNCCETSFQSLGGAFGYQPLVGKLSAVIGDAKSPSRGESSAILEKILHITGGDAVSVNVKNRPALPLIRLFCRFTIAMNDLPAFTDHSRALEYRTNLLTFDNSYVGREDRTLKARLRAEAEQGKIVNWALQGLVDLYQGSEFVLPESSNRAMQQFRELVSPIVEFCQNCVEKNDSLEEGVTVNYLYGIWTWWCGREGRHVGLKSTFVRNLMTHMTDTMQVREGQAENQERTIVGIKVTKWAEKAFEKGE
jgi:putative DNA primase/helicase